MSLFLTLAEEWQQSLPGGSWCSLWAGQLCPEVLPVPMCQDSVPLCPGTYLLHGSQVTGGQSLALFFKVITLSSQPLKKYPKRACHLDAIYNRLHLLPPGPKLET